MIVVDTSALIAIAEDEPEAERCALILEAAPAAAMSAVTLAETLIVAAGHRRLGETTDLLDTLGIAIIPVDAALAHEAAEAHLRFGRGNHPARLNFGDCFSYALARRFGWPLFLVGNDFGRTDLSAARD